MWKPILIVGIVLLGVSATFAYGTVTVQNLQPLADTDTQVLLVAGLVLFLAGLFQRNREKKVGPSPAESTS